MNLKYTTLLIILLFSLSFSKVIDRVAAVVGEEIILESEVNQILMAERRFSTQSDEDLKKTILDNLISNKVLYSIAIKDTTILVDDAEVEDVLTRKIKDILDKVGGEKALEQQYNTTVSKLKTEYREDTKKSLFIRKLKDKELAKVKIYRSEVDKFYDAFKDSLPEIEESVTLAQLVVKFDESKVDEEKVLSEANEIREKIVSGEMTFEEAAEKYSDDKASAKQGGDIGTTSRGDLVKEYEAAAYSMDEGDVSRPIKSQFGYHIIRLDEKVGEKIRTSHILLQPEVNDEGYEIAKKKINLVADSIKNQHMTFEEAVKRYSNDEASKSVDGRIGRLVVEDLSEEYKTMFRSLDAGEISEPAEQADGYYLYKVLDKEEAHTVDFKRDYTKLKNWALERKKAKHLQKWIEDLKNKVYIEIK